MSARQEETEWRQGRLLSVSSAQSLSLAAPNDDDPIVMLISHDCDITASLDAEPECEIIRGRHIEEADGNYANSRNPRELHLTFTGGAVHLTAAFVAADKQKIAKTNLLEHRPAEQVILTPGELNTLRTWLAARYDRAAFPTTFDRRLKDGAYKEFVSIVKKTQLHLRAILFDVDAGEEIERDRDDDVYSLRITLLYSVETDPGSAEIAAKQASTKIIAAFKKHYIESGQWRKIELESCDVVSEAALSVHAARCMREWNFDYLSLKDEA